MAAVWPVGTYIDNLKTNLTTRFGTESLASVEIFTGGPSPTSVDDDMEMVVLAISVETDEEPATLGGNPNRNEEANVIECAVAAWDVVGDDGEEAAIKAARDRALVVLGSIEREIRKNFKQGLTDTVRHATISRKSMDQGVQPDKGRVCVIEFDISLNVRTNV